MADYTITGAGGNYIGTEKIAPNRSTSGSVFTNVLMTVVGWMTAGKTVEFIGAIEWTQEVQINQYIIMDFGNATILILPTIPLTLTVDYSEVNNGFWTGASGLKPYMQVLYATNSRFQNMDCNNLRIDGMWASSYVLVAYCYFHNVSNPSGDCTINLQNDGHNTIQHCRFKTFRDGVLTGHLATHNKILHCEFDDANAHAIYIDGAQGGGGHNEIAHNKFTKQNVQACLHIKCPENKIYDNDFYDFPSGGIAFSIYSQYSPSYANDNDIYDNRFTNISAAISLGTAEPSAYPTLQNKIHDNVFTNVKFCFCLTGLGAEIANVVKDTWIYYNKFINCTYPFHQDFNSHGVDKVVNTVIAYNEFAPAVPQIEVDLLHTMNNMMIYGNTGLADFNVPTPPPIPPPVPPTYGALTGIVKKNDGTPVVDATVTIDGLKQTTGADGSYFFENLQATTYQMTVTASGYNPWSAQITVIAGQELTQNAILTTSITPRSYSGVLMASITAGLISYYFFKGR